MKTIIAGSRSFTNYELLKNSCVPLLKGMSDVEIVSGTANGADKLGERYALENDYQIKRFPAQWDIYGKSAGYIRNEEMAKYANMLIAFWDGQSKGTMHMINLAKKHNLDVYIIQY